MRARALLVTAVLPVLPLACNGSAPSDRQAATPSTVRSEKAAAVDTAPDGGPSDAEEVPRDPEPIAPSTPHAFSPEDLLAMDRISGHQVSPDGSTVAFVRRVTDLRANRGRTDLWSVAVAGGEPRRLTEHPESDGSPRWAPDGNSLFFLSSRSGSSQVWKLPLDGGKKPVQVTDLPVDVHNLLLSPTGEHLAFTAEVFVDCEDLACTAARMKEREQSKQTGQVYDRLFARHWDTWKDGRRSHPFVMPIAGGSPVDLGAGMDADIPSKPFGGAEEITFSADGKTVVFAARDVGPAEPWSTNFDLFAAPIDGGERRNLTADNPAWDTRPVFSPDGKLLVYKAMNRPGYEADRFGIRAMPWPDGEVRTIADDWDRSAGDITFAPSGDALVVTAQDIGQVSVFSIGLEDGKVEELVDQGTNSGPAIAGDRLVYAHHDLTHPAELFSIPLSGGEPEALTSLNATKVEAAGMGEAEQFSFAGARGDTVHGYLVRPVDFDASKRYPIAFLIHGGPQGSFGNKFHYRWNPQVYAGAGYAAVMIDFHGSTGYGQAFTDAIRDDWGGKPLTDLQKGLAAITAEHDWLDGERICALGASYGGYMINWIEGKWPDRFDCLVNHDGVFDMRMMYYATEELWFPEWEHLGPYYENPRAHEKHNPVLHVDAWKTPMLVVHGALDFRIPESQGIAAFTALQRRGIESRLLFFPDENHWVLAPANSLQWHDQVLGWLNRHLQAS